MDIDKRNEEVWRLRKEGVPLTQIATRFRISRSRVQQICSRKQDRMDNFHKWPPLKRILPGRVQKVLIKTFGSEEILNFPEKLASLGPEVFYKWRNIGRKSVKQLIVALESLGFAVSQKAMMTNPGCQIFLKIGKAILRDYFDYYVENSLDDGEYIPIVRVIIEGIAKEMESGGMGQQGRNELIEKLKNFNRQIYQNRWIKQVEEAEDRLDKEKEYQEAKKTFDYVYKHGKHPR
jgi:hypothetical protein